MQHIWDSAADGTFTVAEDPRGNTLKRGTELTLFLKEDASEYLEQHKLEELIKRYSQFVTFPIYLEVCGRSALAAGGVCAWECRACRACRV